MATVVYVTGLIFLQLLWYVAGLMFFFKRWSTGFYVLLSIPFVLWVSFLLVLCGDGKKGEGRFDFVLRQAPICPQLVYHSLCKPLCMTLNW